MNKRWFIYILVGVLFGVFDFYLLDLTPQYSFRPRLWDYIIGVPLTFGIWLVPSVPIVLHEAKVSHSRMLSALANSLTWWIAVIVYYVTNVVQLAIGSSYQPLMSFSHHKSPGFWSNWGNVFLTYIFGHILEWSVVAVVSGFIIGFLISFMSVSKKPYNLSN
jgi:hypothetical protein